MKKAVVMGATSGIGLEVAKLLARHGWQVAVAGRRSDLLMELVQENDRITHWAQIDVTDADAPERLLALVGSLGGMDLYVHSSGVGWQNKSLDLHKEQVTVDTNCMGFTQMLATVFDYLSSHQGGHIAAISSIAGTKGLGAAPAYSASKAFQQHYLESLTQLASMRKLPITVTDIRPGFVETPLLSDARFPLKMNAQRVARAIVAAIHRRDAVCTIDWRYSLLVRFWRLLPRWVWTRLSVG
jgi:short-subunit dehydrogenase